MRRREPWYWSDEFWAGVVLGALVTVITIVTVLLVAISAG